MPRSLRLLTFNLGLAHFPPLMRAPHLADRLRRAPDLLDDLAADVIALQEVYRPAHRNSLIAALRGSYPYALAPGRTRSLLGSGLVFLSRIPIRCGGFAALPRLSLVEHGALWLELEGPAPIRLVNVHLRAESDGRHMAAVDHMLRAAGNDAILLGDFNCGPSVRSAAYRRILRAGVADAHIAAGAPEAPTWDAENPYNQAGRFRNDPSQRIDHVFVPHGSGIGVGQAKIVLDGERPLSDHYGLMVQLDWAEAGSRGVHEPAALGETSSALG